MAESKENIRNLSFVELKLALAKLDEKSFRSKQVYEWLWQKNAATFEQMSNLSKDLRNKLDEHFFIDHITLDDLEFDNSFYFTISKPERINVLSIGENAQFLNKIYTEDEFNFTSNQLQSLNYNLLKSQHLIILNELENIPIELSKTLNEFSKNGGALVVIPAVISNINSYNSFLKEFNIGSISTKIEEEHKITTIVYEHPLLKKVFEKKVSNFQYPTTNLYYKSQFKNNSSILKLDTNEPFICSIETSNSSLFWFASPLSIETSNFTQSSLPPLAVPIIIPSGMISFCSKGIAAPTPILTAFPILPSYLPFPYKSP